MAKPLEEAEAALREFGKRYRDAFFKNHPPTEQSKDTVKDAVREQYEQEQDAERESLIQPPVIESPLKPRDQEHEPGHQPQQQDGPEEGR